LPYLSELRQFEHTFMKYKVHSDLKQFDKALKKLAKAGNMYIGEALSVIKKHRLFK